MSAQQHAGRYAEAALRDDGSLAKGVAVSVLVAGTSVPAILYTDRDRSGTAGNPALTDPQSGMLTFWVDAGTYDLIGPGVTLLSMPVGVDAADVAPLDDNGIVPVANLPVGTTAGTVMAGDDNRIAGSEQSANKGQPGGYAGLDSSGVVPLGNLPGGGTDVLSVAGKTGHVALAEGDIASLVADLAAKAAASQQIIAGSGLTGGGTLAADRTLAVVFGTTAGTVMEGSDNRIAGAVLAATTAAATSTSILAVKLSGDLATRFGFLADGTIISGEPPKTVSNVTGTSTVTVTTSTNHGYGTGDVVVIAGVSGISGVNGTWPITRTSATQFTLTGATGSGTYGTGTGTVQRQLGNTGAVTEGVWNFLLPGTSRDGMVIRGRESASVQLLTARDYQGSPIFSIASFGGAGVYGDKIWATNNVFGRTLIGNESGGLRIASGDPAGGIDVIAEGNAATPPTANPDGSHLGEGSFATGEGVVRWTRYGRPRARTSYGHEDELLTPVHRRVQTIAAPGGDSTLILTGVLPPTVATANITPSSDDQAEGPLVKYLTTAASGVDAGVISPVGAVQPRWAPYFYGRIRTDASAITSTRLAVGLVSADIASNAGPASTGSYSTAAGAWLRYDTGVDGTAFWRTVTGSGTTATVTTTTAAITADTSYELIIEINAAASSIRFVINGTAVATHSTNLPSASAALAAIARLRTLAASARALRFGRITWSSL